MNTFKKRIDELGRIVIPKEIRKTFKINNYEELDVTALDDKIVITKSIGILGYKEKLKKYISLIKKITNYDMLIISNNNVIESTYEKLNGTIKVEMTEEFNNIKKTLFVNNKQITGYMYLDKIIIDSNFLGYILFVNKEYFVDMSLLKNIKNVIIDLLN